MSEKKKHKSSHHESEVSLTQPRTERSVVWHYDSCGTAVHQAERAREADCLSPGKNSGTRYSSSLNDLRQAVPQCFSYTGILIMNRKRKSESGMREQTRSIRDSSTVVVSYYFNTSLEPTLSSYVQRVTPKDARFNVTPSRYFRG